MTLNWLLDQPFRSITILLTTNQFIRAFLLYPFFIPFVLTTWNLTIIASKNIERRNTTAQKLWDRSTINSKSFYSRRSKMVLVAASLSYTDLVDGVMDRERTQVFRIYRTVSFHIWPLFVNLTIHKDHEISKAWFNLNAYSINHSHQ